MNDIIKIIDILKLQKVDDDLLNADLIFLAAKAAL